MDGSCIKADGKGDKEYAAYDASGVASVKGYLDSVRCFKIDLSSQINTDGYSGSKGFSIDVSAGNHDLGSLSVNVPLSILPTPSSVPTTVPRIRPRPSPRLPPRPLLRPCPRFPRRAVSLAIRTAKRIRAISFARCRPSCGTRIINELYKHIEQTETKVQDAIDEVSKADVIFDDAEKGLESKIAALDTGKNPFAADRGMKHPKAGNEE